MMDTTLALFCYKLTCLMSGVLICFLGYRLFVLGIFRGAGELDSSLQNNKIILRKAAPGTFFALFGAMIVGVTVWRGLEFKDIAKATPFGEQKAAPIVSGGRGAGSESSAASDRAKLEARRSEARRTISELNRFPSLLPADVRPDTLIDVNQAIRESKVAILQSVWGPEWGEFGELQRWLDRNLPQEVPAEFRPVAELFQHGTEKKTPP
jgi:hypothetical protein